LLHVLGPLFLRRVKLVHDEAGHDHEQNSNCDHKRIKRQVGIALVRKEDFLEHRGTQVCVVHRGTLREVSDGDHRGQASLPRKLFIFRRVLIGFLCTYKRLAIVVTARIIEHVLIGHRTRIVCIQVEFSVVSCRCLETNEEFVGSTCNNHVSRDYSTTLDRIVFTHLVAYGDECLNIGESFNFEVEELALFGLRWGRYLIVAHLVLFEGRPRLDSSE